jgi:hypothetical protein
MQLQFLNGSSMSTSSSGFTIARRDKTLRCASAETAPLLRANNFQDGDG